MLLPSFVLGLALDAGAPPTRTPLALPGLNAPTTTAERPNAYELRREGDGWTWSAGALRARVARDGSVAFDTPHVTSLDLVPFRPLPNPAGTPTVEGVIRDALGGRRRPRAPKPAEPGPTTVDVTQRMSPYRADPSELCRYPRPCYFESRLLVINATGNMDLTDELMRLGKQDPYRYEKARFLTATRSFREQAAARAHREDVRRKVETLRTEVERIASDRSRTPSERRALLESLRDEMDDSEEGRAGRTLIEGVLASPTLAK